MPKVVLARYKPTGAIRKTQVPTIARLSDLGPRKRLADTAGLPRRPSFAQVLGAQRPAHLLAMAWLHLCELLGAVQRGIGPDLERIAEVLTPVAALRDACVENRLPRALPDGAGQG